MQKDTDYNTTFAEALNVAVEPETYNGGITQTTNSGNSTVNSAGVRILQTNNSSNNYTVISRLTDMDVFDVSGESSLYVNIVYDYACNDAYAAEKMFNTSEAVVVVTENNDGSLSPAMSQLALIQQSQFLF